MKPVVDRLREQYKGRVEFRTYDVTKDLTGISLADQLGAQYVPSFVFFDSEGVKVDMVVGGATEAALKTKLDALK
jgi:thiol-disulfide isomerase/thioredoxin